MITISTTTIHNNQLQKNSEILSVELFEESEEAFYDSIRLDLDLLIRVPKEETIDRILAYSRAKI
ncbi:hypothetical protein LPB86_07740 [Pedobacter sp. MC2016-14]|uniref:hypothetical protein n=1 Tax=Pedobacter sp. MC2016-14 TaxID=2897327 RepID=UPI001E5E6AE2|nr:hypothetical protein [Pedobacter sp. MC2016-14]MCD0488116.1 hypothetical protein [Pedobacter sp. MC2016-14]